MPSRTFTPLAPVSLAASIGGLGIGPGEPSIVIDGSDAWYAARTPDGAATAHFSGADPITVEAWGPGAGWMIEHAPAICGAEDDPSGFHPGHPVVRRLLREHPGVRITRSGLVVEMLVRTIVGQKVVGADARSSYLRMARALSRPAPGPRPLLLPPDPAAMAGLGYAAFHPWGIERTRAETLIRVAGRARRMEEAAAIPLANAYARITAITGVGDWTAAKVGMTVLGDADAVPVGDYNLPNGIAWALAGEPRADDARMLELLDEFRPHRARVIRLIGAGGFRPPRHGPRSPRRRIERM
ncbi:MAG: DNA-3-methyladenine glycosylase 2 family protein [Actinomycetota bacterium]